MTIHFLDGGFAECSEIEVIDDKIYWDGYRYYPVYEVDWIEDDDGSDITMDYLGSIYGSTRKFTKYPQNYVKTSTETDPSIDDMIEYIDAEWENCGCGEKMSRSEAETYLGHSVKDMSWSEIDEEVSAIQKAYCTYGDPMGATDQEIIDKYHEMVGMRR